ncbi:hypothetical protein CSC70_03980 [Pseudoxanthomonas kalamensis DSM 18571]|nr:hypothetical protein CSC70_03980 [Pseudoxanthomonas kalamensis DSM 18571]
MEPEYGYEEADDDIAAGLEEAGEVSELVMDVRNAAALLNWIANNVELPVWALPDFRAIDRQASSISKRADELIEKYA